MATSIFLGSVHIVVVILLYFSVISSGHASELSCRSAQFNCHARSGCRQALNKFFIHCDQVMQGEYVTSCPTDCKNALVSLLSTEDETGLAFINCRCEDTGFCLQNKRRVEICKPEVLEAVRVLNSDSPPVSCNLARWICEADTSCLAALQYYYDHCSRLFKGIRCTSRCKNSLDILSRQSQAYKLRSCLCDGTEEYDCTTLKFNTDRMCFSRKERNYRKHVTKSRYDGRNSNDDDNRRKVSSAADRRKRRRKRRHRSHRSRGSTDSSSRDATQQKVRSISRQNRHRERRKEQRRKRTRRKIRTLL